MSSQAIDKFASKMALIARDACEAVNMDDNQLWSFMSEYRRLMADQYPAIHEALISGKN